MLQILNFPAGIVIALAASTWAKLLAGCVVWAFALCAFIWIKDGRAEKLAISYYEAHADQLILGSPVLTFYAIEWTTNLITALLFSALAFVIRRAFWF